MALRFAALQAQGLPARLRAALASPSRRNVLAGLLDQVVISLANLVIGLLVLRLGTKQEFGVYGLAYTAVMVGNGFAAALFSSQLTVSYHQRPEAERPGFAGALFTAQAASSVTLALLALGFVLLAGGASPHGSPEEQGVLLAILCAPAAMAQDLSRSYRFLRNQGFAALGLDVLQATLWVGLTLLGIARGWPAHVAALGGFGIACAVAALVALLGSGLARASPAMVAASVRSVLGRGSWALGGVLVTALQNQAHLYLLAILASVEAVAELNAARMILSPIGILVGGVNRSMLPLLARLRAEGRPDAMRRLTRQAILLIFGAILAYLASVALAWDLLAAHVLRGEYEHIGGLVILWAVLFAIQSLDFILSARLQAEGRFRSLTLLNLMTCAPVLLVAMPMIEWKGGAGSLVALILGQVALVTLLARALRRAGPD